MISTKSLNKRINLLKNDSIYSSLKLQNKDYLVELGSKYNYSYQELRQLMIISADFSMWKEKSISECVSEIEQSLGPKVDKRAVLSEVKREWNSLKSAKINYEPKGCLLYTSDAADDS